MNICVSNRRGAAVALAIAAHINVEAGVVHPLTLLVTLVHAMSHFSFDPQMASARCEHSTATSSCRHSANRCAPRFCRRTQAGKVIWCKKCYRHASVLCGFYHQRLPTPSPWTHAALQSGAWQSREARAVEMSGYEGKQTSAKERRHLDEQWNLLH